MNNENYSKEHLELARQAADRIELIISGMVSLTDPALHKWALHLLDLKDPSGELGEVLESCAVNILSCDGASWDTPIEEFKNNLSQLEKILD